MKYHQLEITLKRSNSYVAMKNEDFIHMMCMNNFYPQIIFRTHIAKRSRSLLDQIFCKVPGKEKYISVSIVLSGTSDHFSCAVNSKILDKRGQYLLNIYIYMTDPNEFYQIFENWPQTSSQWQFPKIQLNLSININYRIGKRRGS